MTTTGMTLASLAAISALLPLAGLIASAQTSDSLELRNAKAEQTVYRGRQAIHLTPASAAGDGLAIVAGPVFENGTIEVDLAGAPAKGAADSARGFVGIAFRVQPDAGKYELFYLRPTNGRADDQLRRNHSTQYVSFPDWPWHRTRKETPGLYESYVDLEPGAWTKLRIEVDGTRARLYVHGAEQPCLIVNDLKLGITKGAVALWSGPGTDAWFANLRVTPR